MNEKICIADKKPEINSRNSVPQIRRKTESYQSMNSPVDRIQYLQRTIGNQAIGRLIESGTLQAKLRIGQPGDVYEQEADKVAEVMRMPDVSEVDDTRIQRKCPKCLRGLLGKDKKDEKIQAKEIRGETPEVTSNMETNINALRGGGQPLPESTRAFFEPRFDSDFSQVRVHTDAKAAQLNSAINSQAFTQGRDIYLGEGKNDLEMNAGRQLLAHELTHVLQQRKAMQPMFVQRHAGVDHWRTKPKLESADLGESPGLQKAASSAALALEVNKSTGPDVLRLQEVLNKLGYAIAVTGEYDAATQSAVAQFQSEHGIPAPTGRQAGPKTLSTLDDHLVGPTPPPLCQALPKTIPGTCSARHDGYVNAAKCFQLNSWLRCADQASADVCRAISAFNFEGEEGSDLKKCETITGGDKPLTKAKAAWFKNTNSCIWGHWRAAVEALNTSSLPKPSGLTSEWSDAIDICRQDIGSDACCQAQVVAEQNAIERCGSYDSSLFGKLPTDVPGSPLCSDLIRLAIPGLQFTGDFGNVKDRIIYGFLRCCTF